MTLPLANTLQRSSPPVTDNLPSNFMGEIYPFQNQIIKATLLTLTEHSTLKDTTATSR